MASAVFGEVRTQQNHFAFRTQLMSVGSSRRFVMQCHMRSMVYQLQVFETVIRFVTVDVVDMLTRQQFPSKMLLHYIAVLFYLWAAIDADDTITIGYVARAMRGLLDRVRITMHFVSHVMHGAQIPCQRRLVTAIHDANLCLCACLANGCVAIFLKACVMGGAITQCHSWLIAALSRTI